MKVTKENFAELLRQVVSAETSSDPVGWSKDNPLWGHCTVASRLAQDYLEGDVVRGSLETFSQYSEMRWHYWNKLPDGTVIDFTAEQFPDISITDLVQEPREREKDFKHEDVLRRYMLLKDRFEKLAAAS